MPTFRVRVATTLTRYTEHVVEAADADEAAEAAEMEAMEKEVDPLRDIHEYDFDATEISERETKQDTKRETRFDSIAIITDAWDNCDDPDGHFAFYPSGRVLVAAYDADGLRERTTPEGEEPIDLSQWRSAFLYPVMDGAKVDGAVWAYVDIEKLVLDHLKETGALPATEES